MQRTAKPLGQEQEVRKKVGQERGGDGFRKVGGLVLSPAAKDASWCCQLGSLRPSPREFGNSVPLFRESSLQLEKEVPSRM